MPYKDMYPYIRKYEYDIMAPPIRFRDYYFQHKTEYSTIEYALSPLGHAHMFRDGKTLWRANVVFDYIESKNKVVRYVGDQRFEYCPDPQYYGTFATVTYELTKCSRELAWRKAAMRGETIPVLLPRRSLWTGYLTYHYIPDSNLHPAYDPRSAAPRIFNEIRLLPQNPIDEVPVDIDIF